MREPITIRLGAGINTVTVGTHHFDRNAMSKDERYTFRKLLVEGISSTLSKPKRRRYRNRKKEVRQ